MRIKVHCQNRIGILRDILNLLVEYGINVLRGEVGGDHGNAIYLHCPNLINLQFQALRPKFEAIAGVFGVKRVGLMPSDCLLYTSPSPRDLSTSRMPSSA